VNTNISKPPKMSYSNGSITHNATSEVLGSMFGALGGAISYAISKHPEEALQASTEKNGVYVDKIVFQELNTVLRASGKLLVSDAQEASDAIINVTITAYGYTQTDELGAKVAPSIAIKCEMMDNSGKVVWSANGNFPTAENIMAATISIEDAQKTPKVLEDAWQSASKNLAQSIVNGL
jgi:hypothetical protein